MGKELEEWVTCEEDMLSYKPIRDAWTEAVKMKRDIEQMIGTSCSLLTGSQETMLEKQEMVAEKVQQLIDIVQDLQDHL